MKVYYGKRKKPIVFQCRRSHRCHGNHVFKRNSKGFLVSAPLAAVFIGSSLNNFGMKVHYYGKTPMVLGVGRVFVAMVTIFKERVKIF